jgi:hypothetical protein
MSSLALQLAAFANLKFQQIRDGITEADEEFAHRLLQLSVKYWHCGDSTLVPMRLLGHQIDAAQERKTNRLAGSMHKQTSKLQIWRLELLSDLIMEEVEHELKHCLSRSDAALLSEIFSLGKEGIRMWERARSFRRKPMAPAVQRPKYRCNARNAALKRKQVPTDMVPENLLPPTNPSNSNQYDENFSPANANSDEVFKDESEDDHDPFGCTRDPSFTRM